MSENWLLQQNVKIGNDLVNIRGGNPDEFRSVAEWVVENAALFVNVQAALNSVPPALAANVTSTQVVNEPVPSQPQGTWGTGQQQQPAQQNNGGWGAPQQGAPPQFAQPAPDAAPACRHGQRLWKEGTSKAGKPYRMWACPSSNRQDQCEPNWVR